MNTHWKSQGGYIVACSYCGEQIGNSQKYCKTCRTKKGREEILDQNKSVLKGLRALGYCQAEVMLPRP